MTHRYIGTKEIMAWPTEKDGKPGYSVKYADGYISWSPASAFEPAYRRAEGGDQRLTFGDALHFLKLGRRVARAGWNGKGMWLAYTPGSHIGRECVKPGHALSQVAVDLPERDLFRIEAHIDMRTSDGSLMVGWTPNTLDVLAEDWMVIAEGAQ
jgi:hypothetical protein